MIFGSSVLSSIRLKLFNYILFLALTGVLFISCENDLREVEKISSKAPSIKVDTTRGVTVIYSDSAVVKAKLSAPILYTYNTSQPKYEFVKGVTIIFFDDQQKESSRVVSDYAVRKENEKIVELRKNVVVTNIKGDTFKSEELLWDEKLKKFYSRQLVYITKPDGTSLAGTGFESDETFLNPKIESASGTLATGDKLTF